MARRQCPRRETQRSCLPPLEQLLAPLAGCALHRGSKSAALAPAPFLAGDRHGPPPGSMGGQGRWELTQWHDMLAAKQAAGAKPVLLHDCHIGCGSNFAGPTLAVQPCDVRLNIVLAPCNPAATRTQNR